LYALLLTSGTDECEKSRQEITLALLFQNLWVGFYFGLKFTFYATVGKCPGTEFCMALLAIKK